VRRTAKTLFRTGPLVAVVLVIAAATVAATSSAAGVESGSVDRSCHQVGVVTMKLIAGGLKRGRKFSGSGYAVRSGIPPVSQSFNKSFWWIAARIRGRGVGVWATTLAPILTHKPPPTVADTITAANLVAWNNSDWGVLGHFPKNYGTPPAVPPLDNPGRRIALSCVP
jgi:hypothetical protein